jgi:hypothetical protein
MAKKLGVFIVFVMLVAEGLFAQELRITSIQDNGAYHGDAEWPTTRSGSAKARSEWDSLFSNYNLVRIETDPFESHSLRDKIANLANSALKDQYGFPQSNKAHTVYLSMGNRRFICFIAHGLLYTDWWTWIYEVK